MIELLLDDANIALLGVELGVESCNITLTPPFVAGALSPFEEELAASSQVMSGLGRIRVRVRVRVRARARVRVRVRVRVRLPLLR